jgi:8-oxo-dGTP pyrophosphatase MutT (NUDIX family)
VLVEPRDAATVLLLGDQPDLHVFMLQRNLRSAFAAGAHVFPGGAVDAQDDALGGPRRPGPGAPVATRFAVAAIREAFEEAGVLLARDVRSGDRVDAAALPDARRALHAGVAFADVLHDLDAVPDTAALVPMARFITPTGAPRRFDTWFFVAAAPSGHAYRHDEHETVASRWIRPSAALDAHHQGTFPLVEPTVLTLAAIAGFPHADTLLTASRAAWAEHPGLVTTRDAARGWVLDFGADPVSPGVGGAAPPRRTTA